MTKMMDSEIFNIYQTLIWMILVSRSMQNNYLDSPESTHSMFCPMRLFFGCRNHTKYLSTIRKHFWIIKCENLPEVKACSFSSMASFTVSKCHWNAPFLVKTGASRDDALVKLKMMVDPKEDLTFASDTRRYYSSQPQLCKPNGG